MKFKAFSLIELMISLIAISVITAAFTPVISKKLKSADLVIGAGGTKCLNAECSEVDPNCSFCDTCSKTCFACKNICLENEGIKTSDCSCQKCDNGNGGVPHCNKCSISEDDEITCAGCESGYSLGRDENNNIICFTCSDIKENCSENLCGYSFTPPCCPGYWCDGHTCKWQVCILGC